MNPKDLPEEEVVLLHVGKKAPKGFRELPGGMHLGKGIWILRCTPMTNHDELCEKVLPAVESSKKDYEQGYYRARELDREALREAPTSGLLSDGKELADAKEIIQSHEDLLLPALKQERLKLAAEISSLKLKLEVAQERIKELEKL